jgi:hypothetical protein
MSIFIFHKMLQEVVLVRCKLYVPVSFISRELGKMLAILGKAAALNRLKAFTG